MASKKMFLNKNNASTCRVQLANIGPAPNVSVRTHIEPMPENAMEFLDPQINVLQQVADRQAAGGANKFTEPQLNTTIRRKNEINSINMLRLAPQTDLTPRSKASIAPKVTQKMNFAADYTVFKDLVSLNVNDTVFKPEKLKMPYKSRPPIDRTVLPEPQLAYFVEPIQALTFTLPEPELELQFAEENYNFLGVYKKLYNNCNEHYFSF